MIVSRPQTLRYLGPKRNKGKCKWRLDFNIDDIPYSAFYNPAAATRNSITEQDVNLLAIPLIIGRIQLPSATESNSVLLSG